MKLPEAVREELAKYAHSESLKKEMKKVARSRHGLFIDNPDAYIEFLCQYNEFINHERKPFLPMVEKDMKL